MRILHVVQAYYPFQEKGGPVFKVRALASGLARRGNGVTVVTADLGLERHPELQKKVRRHDYGWILDLEGTTVFYLRTIANYRALTINPSVIEFSKDVLPEFDVVHCYGLYDLLGPSIGYFCRHARIPYLVEPMGMYRPIDRSLQQKRFWHRMLGKTFLRGAARMVSTSDLEREELLNAGFPADKVVMRHNGVDPALLAERPPRGAFRAKWGVSPQAKVILLISRLIPRKGADLLIAAFAKVCKNSERLVIAGPDGESGYTKQLEKIAEGSGVRKRVIFCGPLYDEEKKEALVDADIFVLPSRYENFANVAAEAIACEIPVIVSNACGISSLVAGRAGLVIRPEADALEKALSALISDQNLYTQLKNGCRAVAAHLNWDRLVEEMESCYRDVLNEARGTVSP